MPGLTAKVFRTYNASITLQEQLDKLTQSKDTITRSCFPITVPIVNPWKIWKTRSKTRRRSSKMPKLNSRRLVETLKRMKTQRTDKDENKQIALGTSKLNYLDPRISVAWCKKNDVNIEKIFNKTQREKFRWAIDMATEEYVF
uniref:DNA topoisomerase n=1 Tax=Ditylenchus dipsaci TaxID=166011 RepID=A0A915EEK4_9BILA